MSVTRVPVTPKVLNWVVRRSGISTERLYRLFPKWDEWISGSLNPTMKQIEKISNATHTPVGFLYLPEPVQLQLPIPDFRRMATEEKVEPSPDLLDTIHSSQLRQSWYREYARSEGMDPLPFIGTATIDDDPVSISKEILTILEISGEERNRIRTYTEMIRLLREKIEASGVMVFISSIVGSDSHRVLDPAEFRGFALIDEYAPAIFVNGADTKAAQIFTLIHELAHIWLGSSGLSDVSAEPGSQETELWCNKIAAEFLVPVSRLQNERRPDLDLNNEINVLARNFKVSTLVVLRRLFDLRIIDFRTYNDTYNSELERVLKLDAGKKNTGGNYYSSALVRTGHIFTQAILSSAWEGRTSFTEAMRLLGMKSMDTLRSMSQRLAVYG